MQDVTNADGDVDDHEVQASGRYLRVTGTERATQYGYSLWELEVFGPTGPLSQGRPTRASSGEGRHLWALYWPLLMIAAGLPALLAPKDGGDQLVGLLLAGTGVLFQLQKLELVRWTLRAGLARPAHRGGLPPGGPGPAADGGPADRRPRDPGWRVREPPPDERSAAISPRGRLSLGLVLIALGLVLTLGQAGLLHLEGLGRFWPLLLIGVGS